MDPMPQVPPAPPARPTSARPCDPLAAALGNASLLGVGYALLGRIGLAVCTAAVSLALLFTIGSVVRTTWWVVALAVWWIAITAHGWWTANSRLRRDQSVRANAGNQRLVAVGVLLAVVLVFGLVRFDGSRIEQDAASAHANDECQRALSILDDVSVPHRAVDPWLIARTNDSVEACDLLLRAERTADNGDRIAAAATLKTYSAHPAALWKGADDRRADLVLAEATDELDTGLTGDTAALTTAFNELATVLDEFRQRNKDVEGVLAGFRDGLPTPKDCVTRDITDWLGARPDSGDELDQAAEIVPSVAPAAIVGCGDHYLEANEPEGARTRYEQLLDEYPDHELASRAERGVEQATLAIQLTNVRKLLRVSLYESKPRYCQNPAPYGGADPYKGGGPYPTLLYGKADQRSKLPASWRADGPSDAVLVICAGAMKYGTAVATCPYESKLSATGYQDVTFRNRKVPLRIYELRTGRQIADTSIEIGGTSCPAVLHYSYPSGLIDIGPPSEVHVDSSKWDVRAAYERWIDP